VFFFFLLLAVAAGVGLQNVEITRTGRVNVQFGFRTRLMAEDAGPFAGKSSLNESDLAVIQATVLEAASLWVHMSAVGPIMYFNLGSVHVGFEDTHGRPQQGWTFQHGFAPVVHLASDLGTSKGHREAVAAWQKQPSVSWIFERFRLMVAKERGVGPEKARLEGVPAFHIYAPSIVWQVLINPHQDSDYARTVIRGDRCDRQHPISWSLGIAMPAGSGLVTWNGTNRKLSQRPAGDFLSWHGGLPHALLPWRFSGLRHDWRLSLQAFGVRCGDVWYLYH